MSGDAGKDKAEYVEFDDMSGSHVKLPVDQIAYASIKNTDFTDPPLSLMVIAKSGRGYYPRSLDTAGLLKIALSIWEKLGVTEGSVKIRRKKR